MRKTTLLILSLFVLLLGACRSDDDQPTDPAAPPVEATAVSPTAVPPDVSPPTNTPNRDALLAQPWQWQGFQSPVEGFEIQNPQDYLLTFNQDGTVNIKADW